jgi:hypothetical protein
VRKLLTPRLVTFVLAALLALTTAPCARQIDLGTAPALDGGSDAADAGSAN